MIKHIFCDLDGTLFNGGISDKDKKAIKLAQNNGITFSIATGRVLNHSTSIMNEVENNGYLICENGAYIYDNNKTLIYKRILTDIQIKRIISFYKKLDYIDENRDIIYLKLDGNIVMAVDGSDTEYMSEGFIMDSTVLTRDTYNDCVGNIGILSEDPEKLNKLIYDFSLELGVDFDIYKSGSTTMNIVPKLVSKFDAIKIVCKLEKLNLSEVSSIGDSPNDISMLKNIETSFSMEGADDSVKSFSKYETPTVADAINMIIDLNNEIENEN